MSRKFLMYITLWLLFLLLVEINCQNFKPGMRTDHTATLINSKLYILSGRFPNSLFYYLKDFFYLDVSVPFNTQELLWNDLSNINIVPPHNVATSVKGGANNDTLFLYGGDSNDVMNLVYTFDSKSNSWNIPKIAGVDPITRKYALTGILDNKGKMYLWSGAIGKSMADDMLILDTVNLSYGKGSSVGAPSPRCVYGAALLPDNNIIYIGKR